MQSLSLKERGIYALPDGRELVVGTVDRHGCSLYSPHTWKNFGIAEYRVHPDGRLVSKGIPTRWRIEDLKDTGRKIK